MFCVKAIKNFEVTSMERKKKAAAWLYGIGLCGVIILNAVAWLRADFCDWYVSHIFPIWLNTYARLTSCVPFSAGEIMLILAVCITVFGIGFFIINVILHNRFEKAMWRFTKVYSWLLLVVMYIMTLNCFILYHTTDFSHRYLAKESEEDLVVDVSGIVPVETAASAPKSNYTKKNIAILRDYLVEQCNTLAPKFERDEAGNIIYDEEELMNLAVDAMQSLGEEYDQLSGYYVTPKYLTYSGFFSQQSIMGYYFPFSLEANINSIMYVTNVAPTVCHELSHTKGFLFEDDANMIAYLACTKSDNEFVQYCGYLSVLNYVNNDFYTSINKNKEKYKTHVRISDLVANDNVFLTKEDWTEVEKKAVIKTKTVKKVSTELMQTSMKMNGVEEGMQQYNEVVNLLLDYYEGTLF